MTNIEKAKRAKKYFKQAEDNGRVAKELFKEIGDPDGVRHGEEVERRGKEGKEHIEKRIGKEKEG